MTHVPEEVVNMVLQLKDAFCIKQLHQKVVYISLFSSTTPPQKTNKQTNKNNLTNKTKTKSKTKII